MNSLLVSVVDALRRLDDHLVHTKKASRVVFFERSTAKAIRELEARVGHPMPPGYVKLLTEQGGFTLRSRRFGSDYDAMTLPRAEDILGLGPYFDLPDEVAAQFKSCLPFQLQNDDAVENYYVFDFSGGGEPVVRPFFHDDLLQDARGTFEVHLLALVEEIITHDLVH